MKIEAINAALARDPRGFVELCDADYQQQLRDAVQAILEHRHLSPIILLSGPSASGKTGMAGQLRSLLEEQGVHTHSVTLGRYLENHVPERSPRNIRGEFDYESPFCLDFPLLNRHLAMLAEGRTIHIPKYIVAEQRRSSTEATPLCLKPGEMVIFEGIHALNDYIAGRNPQAMKLFIHPGHKISRLEAPFSSPQVRLCRRLARDTIHRAVDPSFTLQVWSDVRRGERLYVNPFASNANLRLESFQLYEISVLKPVIEPLLLPLKGTHPLADELLHLLEPVAPLDQKYLGESSPVKEFLWGEETSFKEEKQER